MNAQGRRKEARRPLGYLRYAVNYPGGEVIYLIYRGSLTSVEEAFFAQYPQVKVCNFDHHGTPTPDLRNVIFGHSRMSQYLKSPRCGSEGKRSVYRVKGYPKGHENRGILDMLVETPVNGKHP